jgi:DNA-binding winged helix-turn-helix (wHTH) protein
MAQGDGPVYRFSGRVLDLGRGILSDAAGRIDLRPKSLALLVYMVRNAGRVISRDELMKAVWPDVIVGDDSLTQCIRDVRRALGDDAQTLVRTIARCGYIFDAAALGPDDSGTVCNRCPLMACTRCHQDVRAAFHCPAHRRSAPAAKRRRVAR